MNINFTENLYNFEWTMIIINLVKPTSFWWLDEWIEKINEFFRQTVFAPRNAVKQFSVKTTSFATTDRSLTIYKNYVKSTLVFSLNISKQNEIFSHYNLLCRNLFIFLSRDFTWNQFWCHFIIFLFYVKSSFGILGSENLIKTKFWAPRMAKNGSKRTCRFSKIIFT